jgi:hypothetical protein
MPVVLPCIELPMVLLVDICIGFCCEDRGVSHVVFSYVHASAEHYGCIFQYKKLMSCFPVFFFPSLVTRDTALKRSKVDLFNVIPLVTKLVLVFVQHQFVTFFYTRIVRKFQNVSCA